MEYEYIILYSSSSSSVAFLICSSSSKEDNLLELYPTLKKGQAEFYSKHCTLGKYYTIGMYKKENDCAYETARTSMDNLASLGFYKKENIRNKFVYTPNPLQRED